LDRAGQDGNRIGRVQAGTISGRGRTVIGQDGYWAGRDRMVTGHYRAGQDGYWTLQGGQDGYWTLQGGAGRQLKKTIAKTVTGQWGRKVIDRAVQHGYLERAVRDRKVPCKQRYGTVTGKDGVDGIWKGRYRMITGEDGT
jgi:hypothetical protein